MGTQHRSPHHEEQNTFEAWSRPPSSGWFDHPLKELPQTESNRNDRGEVGMDTGYQCGYYVQIYLQMYTNIRIYCIPIM